MPGNKDSAKTKAQLVAELAELRERLAGLEAAATASGPSHAHTEYRLLRGLLQSLDIPLYVIDADTYEVLLANAAVCRNNAPWGMKCHELTHQRTTPCCGVDGPCPLETVRRTKQPAVVEHRHYDADGSARFIEVHAFPLYDADGNVTEMVEYNVDVTERRRVTDELRMHERSLEMMVRRLELSNEELRAFTSMAAHDIRSPMASIAAAASLLSDTIGNQLSQESREALGVLTRGVQRTSDTIAALYRCSQVSAGELRMVDVDLNRIVHELNSLQLLAELDRTGGRILVPKPLQTVHGDEMQILGLMQNLIGNALKFHRQGVPPVVTVHSRTTPQGRVRIEVEDNGVGIREADRARIFEMFTRLDDGHASEGLGLGLAFCKRVVERHHGQIGVESTYGVGSTFWVELPGHPPPRG